MPFTAHGLPAWVGHEFVPHAPAEQMTWHEQDWLQSMVPQALEPVHCTEQASVPQSIVPHAPVPLQSIVHAKPSGQVIVLPPADELILQTGGDALSVQPLVHSDGHVTLLPLPAPTQ